MDWAKYFEMLIDWKQLPAYRLEPRIDSFIGYYLREIVSCFTGKEIIGVIPEFPIKKEQNNQSNRVDFLLISKEGPHYLVEVKTDSKSRRKEQDDYLKEAKGKGLEELVNSINSIYEGSGEKKEKYEYFIKKLEKSEIVKITNEVKNKFEFKFIDGKNKEIEIIYVQPSKNDKDIIIDFEYISEWIKRNNNIDNFEKELCKALLEWEKD